MTHEISKREGPGNKRKKQGKTRRWVIVSSQGEGKSAKALDDGQGIMIVPR